MCRDLEKVKRKERSRGEVRLMGFLVDLCLYPSAARGELQKEYFWYEQQKDVWALPEGHR